MFKLFERFLGHFAVAVINAPTKATEGRRDLFSLLVPEGLPSIMMRRARQQNHEAGWSSCIRSKETENRKSDQAVKPKIPLPGCASSSKHGLPKSPIIFPNSTTHEEQEVSKTHEPTVDISHSNHSGNGLLRARRALLASTQDVYFKCPSNPFVWGGKVWLPGSVRGQRRASRWPKKRLPHWA